MDSVDAVVVGAGFFGSAIATYLLEERGFVSVLVLEQETDLFTHASRNNQARVHNGYHYPRSMSTAYRSRVNLPRFMRDFTEAVSSNFTKLYAIAQSGSKVTPLQFERFCADIGAYLEPAAVEFSSLFNEKLIARVYETHEYAFNADLLADWTRKKFDQHNISLLLGAKVTLVERAGDQRLEVGFERKGENRRISTPYVFNCTYSGLNHIGVPEAWRGVPVKHEFTEMGLIEVPAQLQSLGITVMDGPFFSMMPYPSRGLHTLSHVRYTPHFSWEDTDEVLPYDVLTRSHVNSRVDRMLRDAARYVPLLKESRHVDSLLEIKTVGTRNEVDDGRPILIHHPVRDLGYFAILGAKIDNIYDILAVLDQQELGSEIAN